MKVTAIDTVVLAVRPPKPMALEYMDWMPPDLFEGLLALVDGCVGLSPRPGHGLTLAPDANAKYRLRG